MDMTEKELKKIMTFPPAPFLLVDETKQGERRYYLIEEWEGSTVDVLADGSFIQTLKLKAHEASEEEIAEHPQWDK